MKSILNSMCLLIFAGLGLSAASAQSDSKACNDELIRGNYGFTVQGTKLGGMGPTGQQVGVAMTEFDGKGNLTQIDTVTIDGTVVADFTHTPATGTYTVNPDGTWSVSLVLPNSPTLDFACALNSVSLGGAKGFQLLVTNPGARGTDNTVNYEVTVTAVKQHD